MKGRQGTKDRTTRRKWWMALACSVAAMALASSPAGAVEKGETLRFGIQAEPRSLDPHLVITDGPTGHVISNLYNTLVRYDEDMEVIPDLAESWEYSNDGASLTFHLEEGVLFHDGTPCDAAAVKFSFDRIMDPANNSPYSKFFKLIEQIEVLDPATIRFDFKKPWPGFFYQILYVGGMGIVSPSAVREMGDEAFGRQPVGTGPFKLKEWVKGERIVLEKNDRYFRKAVPHLDAVQFDIIPDVNALLTNLRSGKVDLIRDFEAQLMPLVEKEKDLEVRIKMAYTFDWWALNGARPPFDDKRVRHAVNMAINRDELAQAVYGPYAQGATSQISPANQFHHPKTLPTFQYRPEKAKELLEEAGAEGLKFTLYSYTAKPQLAQIATVIQAQLAEIGVHVEHEVLEHQAWLANVLKGREFEASVVPGTGGPEPNNYVMFWTSDNPINFVGFDNPELDRLVPLAQVTIDQEERKERYYEIQEIGADEALWMALIYVPAFAAMSQEVNGYVHLPYNVSYLETVWVAR